MMDNSKINVSEVSRSYGEVRALDKISFETGRGELFGFIGPDGAGKSTLFRILATLLLPSGGNVHIFGLDVVDDYRKIRKITGYMPGRFSLYHDLTVEQNMNFYATIFGTTVKENYHLVRDIYSHIEPFKDRLAGKLSGGMKQKLALSCALIHKPEILLLDEPTTGVDAISRQEFWEMLRRLKDEGICIIVSTPYMDEALLCDKVALIQQGRILALDVPENIRLLFRGRLFSARSEDNRKLLLDLRLSDGVADANIFGQFVHFTLKEGEEGNTLEHRLRDHGHQSLELKETSPGIEDTFISLMKGEA